MTEMTNADAWALLVGALLPFLISYLKKCKWQDRTKFLVGLGICAVGGIGTAYFAGQLALTPQRALIDIALCFLASQSIYRVFLKDSGIDVFLSKQTPLGS